MRTKFWNGDQWEVNLIKFATSTGIIREFAECEAISSSGLHGTTIGTTDCDTSGDVVVGIVMLLESLILVLREGDGSVCKFP